MDKKLTSITFLPYLPENFKNYLQNYLWNYPHFLSNPSERAGRAKLRKQWTENPILPIQQTHNKQIMPHTNNRGMFIDHHRSKYACWKCNKIYSSFCALDLHCKTQHYDEWLQDKQKVLDSSTKKCLEYGKFFPNRTSLRKHVVQKHKGYLKK